MPLSYSEWGKDDCIYWTRLIHIIRPQKRLTFNRQRGGRLNAAQRIRGLDGVLATVLRGRRDQRQRVRIVVGLDVRLQLFAVLEPRQLRRRIADNLRVQHHTLALAYDHIAQGLQHFGRLLLGGAHLHHDRQAGLALAIRRDHLVRALLLLLHAGDL